MGFCLILENFASSALASTNRFVKTYVFHGVLGAVVLGAWCCGAWFLVSEQE